MTKIIEEEGKLYLKQEMTVEQIEELKEAKELEVKTLEDYIDMLKGYLPEEEVEEQEEIEEEVVETNNPY